MRMLRIYGAKVLLRTLFAQSFVSIILQGKLYANFTTIEMKQPVLMQRAMRCTNDTRKLP